MPLCLCAPVPRAPLPLSVCAPLVLCSCASVRLCDDLFAAVLRASVPVCACVVLPCPPVLLYRCYCVPSQHDHKNHSCLVSLAGVILDIVWSQYANVVMIRSRKQRQR